MASGETSSAGDGGASDGSGGVTASSSDGFLDMKCCGGAVGPPALLLAGGPGTKETGLRQSRGLVLTRPLVEQRTQTRLT